MSAKTKTALGGYASLLRDLKQRIRTAQVRAALAINRELVGLYWQVGRQIVERQRREGWGEGVIERLARDLRREFPYARGFSASNIWRMRAFYCAWSDSAEKLAQPVRESRRGLPAQVPDVPWGHQLVLLERLKDPDMRIWYGRMANFRRTLPALQSDLAERTLKDPYVFDFLRLEPKARELDLERGLVDRMQDLLLELGVGFAFVGRQFHLEVDGEDFYVDLLFFHLRLRCFVVIEIKTGAFRPEFAGKMNFYLSAIDDRLRHHDDQPTIGILLCRSRSRLVAEYALRDVGKPIGVAGWRVQRASSLPRRLRGSLPTLKQLESGLATVDSRKPRRGA